MKVLVPRAQLLEQIDRLVHMIASITRSEVVKEELTRFRRLLRELEGGVSDEGLLETAILLKGFLASVFLFPEEKLEMVWLGPASLTIFFKTKLGTLGTGPSVHWGRGRVVVDGNLELYDGVALELESKYGIYVSHYSFTFIATEGGVRYEDYQVSQIQPDEEVRKYLRELLFREEHDIMQFLMFLASSTYFSFKEALKYVETKRDSESWSCKIKSFASKILGELRSLCHERI